MAEAGQAGASPPADAEAEIPSDFFDDFNKAEFIESLSVIDSWDESAPRPGPEAGEPGPPPATPARGGSADLDRYIQPGSRRNPDKTNEAIRRDKDRKVKEYLQKSLEQDIRPPGTELDDFLDDTKLKQKINAKESRKSSEQPLKPRPRDAEQKKSPERDRFREEDHHKSSDRAERDRPREMERYRSPFRGRPRENFQPRDYRERNTRFVREGRDDRSPVRRYSPFRRSPKFYTRPMRRPYSPPRRRSRSPTRHHYEHRFSPRRSPRRRSPDRRSPPPQQDYRANQQPGYTPVEYGGGYYNPSEIVTPGYGYPAGSTSVSTGPAGVPPPLVYAPLLPVPAPMPVPAPSMQVVSRQDTSTQSVPSNTAMKTPYDALAQLYNEGKISKEDYLKLAPTKDLQAISNDKSATLWKEKQELIKRCSLAQSKLLPVRLPTSLVIHQLLSGPERKALPQKFASPLKRLAPVEFAFTAARAPSFEQHNKKTLDLIAAAVGLDDLAPRGRRKPKSTQDAGTQTARPACELCDVRDATERRDAATEVDAAHFSAAAHTQVAEADLVSSRAVFAPSGGVADPMSIAHLTPAQLVSQLAARAKTLKDQPPPPHPPPHPHQQYMRRDYGYERGRDYSNYRY